MGRGLGWCSAWLADPAMVLAAATGLKRVSDFRTRKKGFTEFQQTVGYRPRPELRQPGRRPFSKAVPSETEVLSVKNCKLCSYSKLCNDLPGVCMLIPYVAVAVVTVAIGYLFITQELM
jgi:hypothetical protein